MKGSRHLPTPPLFMTRFAWGGIKDNERDILMMVVVVVVVAVVE